MENPVITLSLAQLALAFVPVGITLVILFRWSFGVGHPLYALSRMLVQLLLIGYVLAWIFGARSGWLIILVLAIMLVASSWIALGSVKEHRWPLLAASLAAITIGGGLTLLLITQLVLQLEPWYLPRYMVPLAGMVFANAMTAVSLAAERLHAELGHGLAWEKARLTAYQAAMIPVINSLFAVGLVALPGMMTGQILAGSPPMQAVAYQIVVMFMIAAAVALGAMMVVAVSYTHLTLPTITE